MGYLLDEKLLLGILSHWLVPIGSTDKNKSNQFNKLNHLTGLNNKNIVNLF